MDPRQTEVTPLSDAIIIAVSKLVDDAQAERWREPSHSEIAFQIDKAGLSRVDPNQRGQTLGKAKRVRSVLYWALENDERRGGDFVARLLSHIRGCGGFRDSSPNYVGKEAIQVAVDAFGSQGFDLTSDGELQPKVLDNLTGTLLTEALESYVRRAKKGATDAALLAGTGKDLLEATAAHAIVSKYGDYAKQSNFPTLLAQAFVALDMSIPDDGKGDSPLQRLERSFYEAGCAINTLRNKEGTGHGRPWITTLSSHDAKSAVETMGIIAEYMLNRLKL